MPNAPPKYKPMPTRAPTPRQENRPSFCKRGYSRKWSVYSRKRLLTHPHCEGVLIDGKRVHAGRCNGQARCTDHIQAVTGPDDRGFWEEANHQSLSLECNAMKMRRVDHAR